MQSVKIEFLEKYNQLVKSANKGLEQFPDEICDYVVNEFDLQAMVLFKVNEDKSLTVLGKSTSTKKNYLRGAIFSCTNCKIVNPNDQTTNFFSDPECDVLISEFIIYEACNIFNISETQKGFAKIARKTPFLRNDSDSFKSISEFLSQILRNWFVARGGEVLVVNKTTSEILNSISQDLRTPANSIIGFASILGEESLTSSQSEYVNTIKSNAHSLLILINDLIDIAKVDSGKVIENKSLIEIKPFFDDILKVFDDKVDKKNVELSYDIDKNIPDKLNIDHQKLRFVIIALIANSVKSTEKGKISVRVLQADNKHLNIRIADTGKGIPSEKRKTLFEPTSISISDNIKPNGNFGLSLVLSKKYIQLLGGDINLDSTVGKGSTFNFSINVESISEIERKIIELPPPTVSTRVLVIEDDYATSKLLSSYLTRWGYNPIIVNSEDQTMELIEKEKFLAIIMDIVLPNINGLELLKKIHEHKNTKHTPVIVCSVEAEQQKAFMLGAVEYFVKPIKYKFLVEVLQSYRLRTDSNILCVDDDVPTLQLLKEAIETAGFKAIAENVSANVMDLVEDKDLDLAIIDLDMPHPNGFELIKLIKSNPKFIHLPIIIYTGKENYQEDLKNIDGLFEELLSKRSTNIEDLSEVISKMINRYDTPPPQQEVFEKKDVIKILLAEDYKHSQIIVTRLLKKNTFENIVVVENGEEAIEMAKQQHFDLILMDMQMPVMNGFEATEKIRLMPQYKDTPIIALTAFAMKGDREKCLEAGATDYIPKPIDSKEFIEKVKYYTNERA
ncbi:MAG: response regulator [Ignavibacteriales bacterium]|nr:response regulator [Ignavibacteriales bacterium]